MRSPTQHGSFIKRNLRWLILVSILPFFAHSQSPTPSSTASRHLPAKAGGLETSAPPLGDLKSVLAQMDQAARSFESAEAEVELVQYTKVVDDTSKQSGRAFFRRHGKNINVALHLFRPQATTRAKDPRTPAPQQTSKQVVVNGDSFSWYDPNTGECKARKIGDYQADVETMMNLGFGGGGQELLRDFEVKLAGWETMDRVQTARLELVPKSDNLKRLFTRLILWIDPKRDVPLQQQRFESSGDYQITRYSTLQIPGKMSNDVFRIKKCDDSK